MEEYLRILIIQLNSPLSIVYDSYINHEHTAYIVVAFIEGK